MQKDPADRYQSAGEMRNDLQRALSGAPVAAPMLGAAYAGARQLSGAPTQMAGRTAAVPPYMYGPEDGGPGGPPRRQRRAWPWVVLVVVVVMLIAAIAAIKFINGGNTGVSVPTVANQSLATAESHIVTAGLKVGTVTHKTSSSVPKGDVISTSPSGGSSASKGSSVNIVESEGKPKSDLVSVPNVVGERRGAAVDKLKTAGFNVNVVGTSSPGTPPNTVVSEHPTGSVKPGATITIDVTAKLPTVPSSVIGMQWQQAQTTLSASPYSYMVIPVAGTPPAGSNYQPGQVYLTSPATGSPLAQGSQITIYYVGQTASISPSPSTSVSASPNPSDSTTPPPGQGATTGQGATGQSTPSPGTSTKATNGIADGLGGALIDG